MIVPGFGFAQRSENSGHPPAFPHHMFLERGAYLFLCRWGIGCFGSKSSGEENKAAVLTIQPSQSVCLLFPGAEA